MKKRTVIIIMLILAAVSLSLYFGGYRWIESLALHRTMETDSRLKMLKVDRVVETLGLKSGQKIADIGAGTGLFTWPMARKIAPNGIIYAVDINAFLLKNIEEKAASLGIANIRTVKASADDPLIPEPVDLIFSCGTFHYLDRQTDYFRNLHKYLKKGGRIAIIDLEKSHPIGDQIKYTPEEQDIWMREAGFVRAEKHDFLEHFYFVIYKKSE